MKPNNENRRALRHKAGVPVEFESGKGVTRDFSASGIYFEADRSFSPGQSIEFTLILEHVDYAGPVRVKCRGEIVRVEQNGGKIGVATTINSSTIEMDNPTTDNL
jgi:hypothetical protein